MSDHCQAAMIFHPKEAKGLKEHSVTRAIAALGNVNGTSEPSVPTVMQLQAGSHEIMQ